MKEVLKPIPNFLFLCLFVQSSFAQQKNSSWSVFKISRNLDTTSFEHFVREKTNSFTETVHYYNSNQFSDSLSKRVEIIDSPVSINETGLENKEKYKSDLEEENRITDNGIPDSMEALLSNNFCSLTIITENTDTGIKDFFSICQTFLVNDTLVISCGVGFMAGMGVAVKITKNMFSTTCGINADGTEVFKINLTDRFYRDYIEVDSKNQRLTLLSKPALKENEVIYGYLEADFNPFYELDNDKPVLRIYHAKVFFKCKLDKAIYCANCPLPF